MLLWKHIWASNSLIRPLGDQFRKAVVLERLGRNEQAVAILRSLSDPTGTSQRRLAKILLDQGDLEIAYEAANAALQLNQGDLSHLTVWCEVQLQRGELEDLRKVGPPTVANYPSKLAAYPRRQSRRNTG